METPAGALEIREAQVGDAPAVGALFAELGFPASTDVLTKRLEAFLQAGETALLALQDGAAVGLGSLHVTPVLHRPTPVGRLTALVVTERARGQGVGRALVEAAEQLLQKKGCALVEVTSNQQRSGAHAFYQRLGYELTSLRFKKLLPPLR